jgi:hypothetical protein
MSESAVPVIGDIEAEFRDDLTSDRFDRYLFVTYRVDEPYLEQFGPEDSVLVCGPEEVGAVVEGLDRPNVGWRQEQVHAKCYLLWNDDVAKVWFGSFNLTETGLRNGIEWGVTHEAQLDDELSLSALRDGACDPEAVTADVLVQQVLDVILATLGGRPPALAADVRSTPGSEDVTVLTNGALPGPSGFHEALAQILDDASGVTLTYFTPFVTDRGVVDLIDAVPSRIDRDDIDLEIRTCRIEAVDNPDAYLDQTTLETLDAQYGSVSLLARAAGQPGEELQDGTALRSGLAHFKTLVVAAETIDGPDRSDVILTSANLSRYAWHRSPRQLEFGLWVRDPSLTEQLVSFFLERLRTCYSTPNQLDFDTIASLEREEPLLSQQSLLARFASQCTLTASGVRLDWVDGAPPLEHVAATLYLRDLTSDDRDSVTIDLTWRSDEEAFHGAFDTAQLDPGWVVHRLELTVTTPMYPIEYELTAAGHEAVVVPDSLEATLENLTPVLERRDIDCDQFVVNEDRVIDADRAAAHSVDRIDSLRIRRRFAGGARDLVTTCTPDTQPQFGATPITVVTATTIDHPPFGGFGCVDVTAAPSVALEHDMLVFADERGEQIEYLGYVDRDDGSRYVFDDSVAGSALTVQVGAPYARYFDETSHTVTMPTTIPDTDDRIRQLHQTDGYRFTHQPVTTGRDNQSEEFITSETAVEIRPPEELAAAVDTSDRLSYEWRRRIGGYRAPTVSTPEQPIPPNPAHSRVEYHGLLSLGEDDDFSLLTPANQFRVKQQVFASGVSPDSKVARGRNLTDIDPEDHVGWLVFASDSLLKPSVRLAGDRSIDFGATIDDTAYDCSASYRVFDDGELFLVPLFGRHVRGRCTLTLRLQVVGGPASYGASELVRELRHEWTGDGVRRTVFDGDGARRSQIDIPHDPAQRLPRLDMYQDQIQSRELERHLNQDTSFHVHERTPSTLTIEALDATVLCLGPYTGE